MRALTARLPRVMAIYPAWHGFGWAVFQGPLAPHDWGVVLVKQEKNVECLNKIDEMLGRFQPETLVLEAYEGRQSLRRSRIQRLCQAIVALASDRAVDVVIYTKDQIRGAFRTVGARTRHEIAQAVAHHITPLSQHLPQKRKPWNGEDKRMSLFAAAALVLTHYHLSANQLFEDLRLEMPDIA